MKQIITLMIFCLGAGMLFAQPALKVDANSRVGIGTASPQDVFEINHPTDATMRIAEAGSLTDFFTIRDKSATQVQIEKVSTGSEALIDINPKVSGNGDAWFRFFRETQTGGKVRFMVYKGDNTNTINSQFGGNQDSYLNADFGNVGIGVTAPQEKLHVNGIVKHNGLDGTSDRRLKKNIKSLSPGLEAVMSLNPVSYQYNGKAGIVNNTMQYGLIAQEVQKVLPDVVREWDHIVLEPETDKVLTQETYLSMQTDAIQYILINAVKEQQKIIDDQNIRLNRLEELLTSGINKNELETTLSLVDEAKLNQNTPNPFNGVTNIEYAIPTGATSAELKIFSHSGQLLKTVSIDHVGPGSLKLNSGNLPSGTYSYHLMVDGKQVQTNKMILQN